MPPAPLNTPEKVALAPTVSIVPPALFTVNALVIVPLAATSSVPPWKIGLTVEPRFEDEKWAAEVSMSFEPPTGGVETPAAPPPAVAADTIVTKPPEELVLMPVHWVVSVPVQDSWEAVLQWLIPALVRPVLIG